MEELVTAIPTGVAAFTATNLDDIVILTLLFSQVNETFRPRHIVCGQYLGFSSLVVISLCGFFGGLLVPLHWIGLLGLVPITFGLNRLLTSQDQVSEEIKVETEPSDATILSPQTCSVAALTIANGSDNIGIYVPLFASTNLGPLLVILSIFFLLVGVWCYSSYRLTKLPALTDVLTRYGDNFVPWVLIGLGVFIVLKSNALNPFVLAAGCLSLIVLVKINDCSLEVEKN